MLDGRGAKRVGRAQQHAALLVAEAVREFADGGGFAGAVDAHHQNHGGRLGHPRHGALGGLQDFEQVLADEPFQFGGIAHQSAVHALADAVQNLLGGAHADVGTDQREFQFVQQIGVDLLGALQHVLEARDQARAGLLHAALQALQQSGLLFDGAE